MLPLLTLPLRLLVPFTTTRPVGKLEVPWEPEPQTGKVTPINPPSTADRPPLGIRPVSNTSAKEPKDLLIGVAFPIVRLVTAKRTRKSFPNPA